MPLFSGDEICEYCPRCDKESFATREKTGKFYCSHGCGKTGAAWIITKKENPLSCQNFDAYMFFKENAFKRIHAFVCSRCQFFNPQGKTPCHVEKDSFFSIFMSKKPTQEKSNHVACYDDDDFYNCCPYSFEHVVLKGMYGGVQIPQ